MLKDEIFKKRWLTTNEVYMFLSYIPFMLNSNLIKLSFQPKTRPQSFNFLHLNFKLLA